MSATGPRLTIVPTTWREAAAFVDHLMDGATLEVIRTATDGTPNANSCLYGAC